MQVKDLIEMLQEMDPEATVHFAYNYGDRGHTMVAPEVTEVETALVAHNAYVNDTALVDEDREDDNAIEVVVLR